MTIEEVLASLAKRIIAKHKLAVECDCLSQEENKPSIKAAKDAGNCLIACKARLDHEQWLPWLAKNCSAVSVDAAERYMALARSAPQGFEEAHSEWLRARGETFLTHYRNNLFGLYKTQYWKLVTKAVFIRDHYKCFKCAGVATAVHHKTYDTLGAEHLEPDVLFSVCSKCHSLVEYARKAIQLSGSLERRIRGNDPTIFPNRGLRDIEYTTLRYIEAKDHFDEIKTKYANKIPYKRQRDSGDGYSERIAIIASRARAMVSEWSGNDFDKLNRIHDLLQDLNEECLAFADEVLTPTTSST